MEEQLEQGELDFRDRPELGTDPNRQNHRAEAQIKLDITLSWRPICIPISRSLNTFMKGITSLSRAEILGIISIVIGIIGIIITIVTVLL